MISLWVIVIELVSHEVHYIFEARLVDIKIRNIIEIGSH